MDPQLAWRLTFLLAFAMFVGNAMKVRPALLSAALNGTNTLNEGAAAVLLVAMVMEEKVHALDIIIIMPLYAIQDLVCAPRPAGFIKQDGSARVSAHQQTSELVSSAQVPGLCNHNAARLLHLCVAMQ